MKRPGKPWLPLAIVAATVAMLVAPAAADSYSFGDGHDVSNTSALDILSARVGHKGLNILHAVGLERKASPRGFAKIHGFIDFLINTTGDWRDGAQRRIYILGGSSFRVYVTNGTGRVLIGRGNVYHPSPKTLGAIVSPSLLGNPDGYLWFAVAVSNDGDQVDAAPNKTSYIHDLTAPVVTSPLTSDLTSATTDTTNASVPLAATIQDTGFMDIRAATIRWRSNGDTGWLFGAARTWNQRSTLDARLLPRTLNKPVSFAQGTTVDTCISVADAAGNWSVDGITTVQVPYDDKDTTVITLVNAGAPVLQAGTYGGTYTPLDSIDSASATIDVTGQYDRHLLVWGSTPFTIDVSVNGGAPTTFDDTQVVAGVLDIGAAAGWNGDATVDSVAVTVTSGILDLDGYLGAPAIGTTAGLGSCGGRPTTSVVSGTFAAPGARLATIDARSYP